MKLLALIAVVLLAGCSGDYEEQPDSITEIKIRLSWLEKYNKNLLDQVDDLRREQMVEIKGLKPDTEYTVCRGYRQPQCSTFKTKPEDPWIADSLSRRPCKENLKIEGHTKNTTGLKPDTEYMRCQNGECQLFRTTKE